MIDIKANDLEALGDSLAKSLRKPSAIREEAKWGKKFLHWKVKVENVYRAIDPIEIPKSIFRPRAYRITTPTTLTKKKYDKLVSLFGDEKERTVLPEIESSFPEGRLIEMRHRVRERNPAVVKSAKNKYKLKNPNMPCQVCGFSFSQFYGNLGGRLY